MESLCPFEDGCAIEPVLGGLQDPLLGGYEVDMPASLPGVPSYGYRVRIEQVDGDQAVRCSDRFHLTECFDDVERTISVSSPDADFVGVAGGNYTVKVRGEKVRVVSYRQAYSGGCARELLPISGGAHFFGMLVLRRKDSSRDINHTSRSSTAANNKTTRDDEAPTW